MTPGISEGRVFRGAQGGEVRLVPEDPRLPAESPNPIALAVRMREMTEHLSVLTQFIDFYCKERIDEDSPYNSSS